nr:MAG TPA: hypothetical protein [Caudoviricetes sp.]
MSLHEIHVSTGSVRRICLEKEGALVSELFKKIRYPGGMFASR